MRIALSETSCRNFRRSVRNLHLKMVPSRLVFVTTVASFCVNKILMHIITEKFYGFLLCYENISILFVFELSNFVKLKIILHSLP